MLSIALPNGTMEFRVKKLFSEADIPFMALPRRYQAAISHPWISRMVFMRPQIIPYVVARGQYDIGITGSDCVMEAVGEGRHVDVLAKLNHNGVPGYSWGVALVGSKDDPATCLADIEDGQDILSEYPHITRQALRGAGRRAEIHFSHGATEAHIPHDFRYGVCITATGKTLQANNLKVIEALTVETAVIIGTSRRLETKEKERASMNLIDALLRK